jgi:transcriptional antiterminator Rof (Rho-off)
MKKLILAVIMCFAFSVHATAACQNANFKRIEIFKKKINALKLERKSIEDKLLPIRNKIKIAMENKIALKEKITKLELSKTFGDSYFKALIKKKENGIEESRLLIAIHENLFDFDNINFNIDKTKIKLIKAEIKAGKTPKIPLEIAKSMVKYNNPQIKIDKTIVKTYQAKIKEKEAYVKYFKSYLEIGDKEKKIRKNTNDLGDYDLSGYIYNTNIEIAKMYNKQAILRLKLKQAQNERAKAEIKEAQAKAEFSKVSYEFCQIFLKFDKVINKKDFMSHYRHD